jgi:hypothetical protein
MRRLSILVVVAVVAGLGAASGSVLPAGASNPCGATGAFNGTDSCTYTTVGSDTFVVPPGVSSVNVVVVGAGGAGGTGGTGGSGARVTTPLDVTGLSSLGLFIGGGGLSTLITPPSSGNWEGGGGDGSAVDPTTSHRIVAGGGGGGPSGGDAGTNADGSGDGVGDSSPGGGGPNGVRGCDRTNCGNTGWSSSFPSGAYPGGGGGYGGGASGGAGGSIDPSGIGYAAAGNGGGVAQSSTDPSFAQPTAKGGNGSIVISWGTHPVVVDNQAPTVSVALSSPNAGAPDGTNGWFKTGPVTGMVTANDTTTGNSNIASIACTAALNGASAQPLTLSAPTGVGTSPTASGGFSISAQGSAVIACTATDVANNTSTPVTTLTVMLDSVAPMVTCPATQPHFVLDQSGQRLTAGVADPAPGSGPVATVVTGNVNTANLGTGSVQVAGTDRAGNSSSATCAYSVAAAVKMYLPGNSSIPRGRPIRISFALVDANGKPIPDAIAMTANLQVALSGGASVKATYSSRAKTFNTLVPTSRALAAGTYSLSVTSNTASIPITPTTVRVKITRGRRSRGTIAHPAR